MSLLYRDDIGANLVITTGNTGIPLTATITLHMQKPGGSTVDLAITPSMINYTTGVITYPTVSGDLDDVGEYIVQLHGAFDDGTNTVSDEDSFYVHEKLIVT